MHGRLSNLGDKLWGPMVEVVKPIPFSVQGNGDGFTAKTDKFDGRFEARATDRHAAIDELCEHLAELYLNLFKHNYTGMPLNPSQEQDLSTLSEHLRVKKECLPKTGPSETSTMNAN